MKKVKNCFGRCGDQDVETHPYPGSKEKPRLHCTTICQDFPLCRQCYYLWWKHQRPREIEIKQIIKKFMNSNNLKFMSSNKSRFRYSNRKL